VAVAKKWAFYRKGFFSVIRPETLSRGTMGPVPGGYKYGNLALQVGGASDETVKYGL
jgi:hypothetical protein